MYRLKHSVLFLAFNLSSLILYSQSEINKTDSLLSALSEAKHDSLRSLIYAELALQYFIPPDSIYAYATKGLDIATKIQFERGMALNLYCLAIYHTDHSTSIDLLNRALEIERKLGNKKQLARIYMLMGTIMGERNEAKMAVKNAQLSYQLFLELNDENGIVISLNNLGFELMKLKSYDSSEYYLKKAINTYPHSPFYYGVLGSLAELYLSKGDLVKATKYILMAIEANDNKDVYVAADNYKNLSIIYERRGLAEDALLSAQNALKFSRESQNLNMISQSYQRLSHLYQKKRNYELAFKYLSLFEEAKDSLFSISRIDQEKQMISQFNEQEKEARITILRQENDLREAKLQIQQDDIERKNIYIIGFVIVAVSLLALSIVLRSREISKHKHIKIIEEKNEKIESQSKELQELIQKLTSLNANLENEAIERATRILEQERKLSDYAFINSHKLRGPVATITGIMNLYNSDSLSNDEKKEMINSIFMEVEKIDKVIKEISRAIE